MKICSVESCGKKQLARGLCCAHYQRVKRGAGLQPERALGDKSGIHNSKWRGGQSRMPDGRVLIFSPSHPNPGVAGKYVLRYRLVMESVLGRYLRLDEVVHHKNGIPWDDRPENLEVMKQSEHALGHIEFRERNERGQLV